MAQEGQLGGAEHEFAVPKRKSAFVFTGNIPSAPGRNFEGIWAMTIKWMKLYVMGALGLFKEHKMSMLLSMIGTLVLVIPVINMLVLLSLMFIGSYAMAGMMHVQRQKVSGWWDSAVLHSFKNPGWGKGIGLSLLGLALMIVISVVATVIGVAPFLSLMFGSTSPSGSIVGLILGSLLALIVMLVLLQGFFYIYALTVPLVFFHKQGVLEAFTFATKAAWVHWRQIFAIANVAFISGFVVGLLASLLGITVIGLVFAPVLLGYFMWVQFHLISANYKYMLLEYKTIESH